MFYWKIKEWPFSDSETAETQRAAMLAWIAANGSKYAIRQIFVCNAWAVEYKDLLKA